jgi:hypothetical protein
MEISPTGNKFPAADTTDFSGPAGGCYLCHNEPGVLGEDCFHHDQNGFTVRTSLITGMLHEKIMMHGVAKIVSNLSVNPSGQQNTPLVYFFPNVPLKGTVRPDWISLRVVSLDRP